MAKAIRLLAYRDMQALDLAGPLDVFSAANARAGSNPPCKLWIIGLSADNVRAENGLAVSPESTLDPEYALDNAPWLDILLIPGGVGSRTLNAATRLLVWLRERASTTWRMASVCTGLCVLAATGLLDSRQVTTHWRFPIRTGAV